MDYEEQRKIKEGVHCADKTYTNATKLGLDYDYESVGKDIMDEVVEESRQQEKTLARGEINRIVESRLKARRPQDFCLRLVMKMCYFIQKLRLHLYFLPQILFPQHQTGAKGLNFVIFRGQYLPSEEKKPELKLSYTGGNEKRTEIFITIIK